MVESQKGVGMSGYIVCFVIGVIITYLYFVNTNDSLPINRNHLRDELLRQKAIVAKIEKDHNAHAEIISAQTTRSIENKNRCEKMEGALRSYEESAMQIHKDYLYLNAYVAKIERQYASLTPVHIHYKKDLPPTTKGTPRGSKRKDHQINV